VQSKRNNILLDDALINLIFLISFYSSVCSHVWIRLLGHRPANKYLIPKSGVYNKMRSIDRSDWITNSWSNKSTYQFSSNRQKQCGTCNVAGKGRCYDSNNSHKENQRPWWQKLEHRQEWANTNWQFGNLSKEQNVNHVFSENVNYRIWNNADTVML